MTDETSTDSNSRGGADAERLLARAEKHSEVRAQLITRWALVGSWSCLDGIALAWTLDPKDLKESILVPDSPKLTLPEDAEHYLELARSSSDPEFYNDRVLPSRFIAWAHGAGLAFHPDWYNAILRRRSEFSRRSTRHADVITRRENLIRLWALAPFWYVEEGVALAYDLDPKKAIVHSATGYGNPHIREPEKASHLLNLAFRAKGTGALNSRPTPVDFMKWARSMGVEFDSMWWDSVVFEEEESEAPLPKPPVSEFGTREQDSLLKLVGGMAIGGYGWDHDSSRNSATKDIADDLARLGVQLHGDTIRKWLRLSADLIPPQDD